VPPEKAQNLTRSIALWNAGDLSVETELMETVYPLLRSLAQDQLSSIGPITMQATELANEAFIKLRLGGVEYVESKQQFMNFMARMLRNLVVDHIREKNSLKRGGELLRVQIEELEGMAYEEGIGTDVDWVALDTALIALEQEDPTYARLVELRYFLGYSIDKSAEQLGVSTATANRMWRFSRAFLSERMRN
jgi:RNA polymerase sigma factor (TIGR02999 family)